MSVQVTTAFVQQYGANVYHLSQQKGSRLRNAVRNETQVGKTAYYDQIGLAEAQPSTGRHSDTPQMDTPHARRAVTLVDYDYADLVDNEDKIRMLIDPTSEYAQAAVWALGRAMDSVIIAAHDASALTGEDGSTSVALGNGQKIASTNGSTAGDNLNINALIKARDVLGAGEAINDGEEMYIACAQSQISSLLKSTQVTSADYNSVKALVKGEIDTFMGFKFIRLQRLSTQSGSLSFDYTLGTVGSGSGDASGYRKCFAWSKSGMLLALGQDIKSRISERADKRFSMQVYASMGIGATRMEEAKVVQILCKES